MTDTPISPTEETTTTTTKGRAVRGALFLAVGLAFAAVAGASFRRQWEKEPLYPSPALTRQVMLSAYLPALKDTPFDTEVYIFEGKKPGGNMLICGGTHPNEPGAYLAGVLMLENLKVEQGKVFLIPRANAAGFTHNDAQEAYLQRYDVPTSGGARTFRNGSRFSNPAFQWPDPGIYVNPRPAEWKTNLREPKKDNPGPGGQTLSGVDSRNLNRVYPGRKDGTPTERVAFAIMDLIRQEKIDLAIDLHEASPEYPTINVIVAHQRAIALASAAELALGDDGVPIATDSSAINLRGLSHREWGDLTDAMALLMESANPSQGRLKGRTTVDQIVSGRDMAYYRVQLIQRSLNEKIAALAAEAKKAGGQRAENARRILNVEFPQVGIPIDERVGRHVMATQRLIEAFNDDHAEHAIGVSGLPSYKEIRKQSVGAFLHPPK